LAPRGELPENPDELDLLARMAVQQCRFAEAKRLWGEVLNKAPDHEPAREGLRHLGSLWLVVPIAKRIAPWAGITFLGCFALIGLFALSTGLPFSRLSGPTSATTAKAASTRPSAPSSPHVGSALPNGGIQASPALPAASGLMPTQANSASTGERRSTATRDLQSSLERLRRMQTDQARSLSAQIQLLQRNQASLSENESQLASRIATLSDSLDALAKHQLNTERSLEQTRDDIHAMRGQLATVTPAPSDPRRSPRLDIHIESVSVTRVQDHWVVRFDTPLFDHGDHFNNGSTDLLARTAKAIVRTQEKVRLEVIGFVDDEPSTSPPSRQADMTSLGLRRAQRVQSCLEELGVFPPDSMSVSVGTQQEQPFASGDRRNRTASLRIFSR
jgi:flagellar motor protein MotB